MLETVSGLHIEFEEPPEVPYRLSKFSQTEHQIDKHEIDRLLAKGVIKKSKHEDGEIISPIFLIEKTDGSFRLILNLKKTIEFIETVHFKMETLSTILKLVRPNCYMACVDVKDTYYSVPIAAEDHKYLKFMFVRATVSVHLLAKWPLPGATQIHQIIQAPLGNPQTGRPYIEGIH